jgi:hypothetical protein
MDLRRGKQPRNNVSKDEKDDLIADSHGILNMRRKYSYKLFNANGVHNVRHTNTQLSN